MRIYAITILAFLSFTSLIASAYPEFIGYGYSSCLTCHVNGQGSGPLNDYGRALWSAEIASRALYPSKMADEDIAAQSGFLGSVELPYWVRPHIKYRGIYVNRSPGSSQQVEKYYQMQADVGATFQLDEVGKYVGVITYGNVPAPENYGAGLEGIRRMIAREYYIRVEAIKTYWLYAGLLEKVFGLRNIDHTSFQRAPQGFTVRNNSPDGIGTSQGVVIHKVESNWELAGNAFFGNPYDDEAFQQKGYSFMGEYEVGENKRFGLSWMQAKSDVLKKDMAALHYRQGLSKGSSLMFEYGFIKDSPAATAPTSGSYNFLEGLVLLTRGYHLKATVERYNREFKPDVPDMWKYSAGILAFPIPRMEIRAEVLNVRNISNQRAPDDSWAIQGQIHVSL